MRTPSLVDLSGMMQYRIIPSVYPPINFFEGLVDPSEMEIVWEVESLTNERLRQEVGDIFLVPEVDRLSGPGSSVVMAAFTHLSKPTRFSDGTYGVYYAGLTKETAIIETVYHRECFLQATDEDACELTMRLYEGEIRKELHDVRYDDYGYLHDSVNYIKSQEFGCQLRAANSWGIVYNSVRHDSGDCIAAFRPPAISIPHQTSHLKYIWNGSRITEVLDTKSILKF